MARYIDADNIRDYFYEPETGIDDTIYDLICEVGLDDPETEEQATELCHKMINCFKNVVDTEPTIDFEVIK